MADYVHIFDTTLRDGEQSPGCSMNMQEKLQVARTLEDLGVDATADHRDLNKTQVGENRIGVVGAGLIEVRGEFRDVAGLPEPALVERNHLIPSLPQPVAQRGHHPVVQ